jgi:DNA-binding GntR family transcriptional regulator
VHLAKNAATKTQLVDVSNARVEAPPAPPGRPAVSLNQFELAYEAIEERLVTCALRPGRYLALQELQALVKLGRTPVHQAVTRLASDTLIVIHARRGLQIAPIDLSRERELLQLRRDMERFVIRLATERSTASHRNQMLHIKRYLVDQRDRLTIELFNVVDRRIDQLFLAAAAEPFVENTLRPLHTIFRRIGWLYHSLTGAENNLTRTVDVHLALLDAVTNRRAEAALEASDQLIAFVDSMFAALEREIEPSMLDSSVADLERV